MCFQENTFPILKEILLIRKSHVLTIISAYGNLFFHNVLFILFQFLPILSANTDIDSIIFCAYKREQFL